jgi:phosphopantothenoylcysteine decarboxylase/phosphopantothenate--cysteine ligase
MHLYRYVTGKSAKTVEEYPCACQSVPVFGLHRRIHHLVNCLQMNYLNGKQILLGVTGGIAAYKSAELVRQLRQSGAEVRVVMTAAACEFITPLTLQALSGNPVHTDLLDPGAEAAMGHIELARWADALLVAPATANFLARLVAGRADTLQLRHITILGPAAGPQACGETGPGRMLEAVELADGLSALFQTGALAGRQVLVTAGPTREAIDPVRFLSNHSSGRMGFAVAAAAAEAGASVTLISGPVSLDTPPGVQRIDVESAADMHAAVMQAVTTADIFIGVAAVADYRPVTVAKQKLKKQAAEVSLQLERNPDILAAVAALPDAPYTVGFAAETESVENNARLKRQAKGIDMIAANQVGNGLGFNNEENALQVFWEAGEQQLAVTAKQKLARQLTELIARQFQQGLQQGKVLKFNAKDSA